MYEHLIRFVERKYVLMRMFKIICSYSCSKGPEINIKIPNYQCVNGGSRLTDIGRMPKTSWRECEPMVWEGIPPIWSMIKKIFPPQTSTFVRNVNFYRWGWACKKTKLRMRMFFEKIAHFDCCALFVCLTRLWHKLTRNKTKTYIISCKSDLPFYSHLSHLNTMLMMVLCSVYMKTCEK